MLLAPGFNPGLMAQTDNPAPWEKLEAKFKSFGAESRMVIRSPCHSVFRAKCCGVRFKILYGAGLFLYHFTPG